MKKNIACILILLLNAAVLFSDSLKIDKTSVLPGQEITVTLSSISNLEGSAWIGVIPSGTPHGTESGNDAADVDYQYFKKDSSVYVFKAPVKPGSYDFRLSFNG